MVPARPPWQGTKPFLGCRHSERYLLSPAGLWQLFKCKLNMLGLALQNVPEQGLPLNTKMKILLLENVPN